jgi:tRNA-modifying protein YgfZ
MDVATRPRAFVRVAGPDAGDHLQNMVSNDVESLQVGDACPALLLTAKARVIAPLVVWRRGDDDYLLLTEPELGEPVRAHLLRMRLRARCEIELEQHESVVLFGDGNGFATDFPGAREAVDSGLAPTLSPDELEARRVAAGVPRWGREIDDRVLPAEAGLDARAISFDKGCFPGQEPIARQRYRGKVNRRLRVLAVDGEPPAPETPVTLGDKDVGRVTSAVPGLALAYVRVEVPDDAELRVGPATARLH